LLATFALDAKATPQPAVGFSQIGSATGAVAPGGDREAKCPICGRLVCPIPDDLLAASPPDTALSAADPDPVPVIGTVRLSGARVPDALVSIFPTAFEPRGPPFVD
jgi:hypothetical protein